MIAGMGFAQMAWKEALRRAYPWPVPNTDFLPVQQTERCEGAAEHCEHCEYFNMLDRASAAARRARSKRMVSLYYGTPYACETVRL